MGLCVRRLLKVGVARSQWNMRVTGSERALQFVPEHFKWYQKRLKIAGAAALTKTVCTPSRVGASACIKDGRGKRGGGLSGAAQMPFGPRESDSGGLECHHPCLLPREI